MLGLALAGCSNVSVTTTQNDPETRAYMDQVIPAVFGHWSVQALAKYGDKSIYDSQRLARATKNFHDLSIKLGKMASYDQLNGTTQVVKVPENGENKAAAYDAVVHYQRGSAAVHVDAVKHKGAWSVVNASINPLPR